MTATALPPCLPCAHGRGFTLIELIVVIALMSILAIGTLSFITHTAEGYQQTADRSRVAGSWTAMARMSRELRQALPSSVRLAGNQEGRCIEFIPVLAVAAYWQLPVAEAAGHFSSTPLPALTQPLPGTLRAAVVPGAELPTGVQAVAPLLYRLSGQGVISSPLRAGELALGGQSVDKVILQFTRAHRFTAAPDASRRWYLVSDPVSFCVTAKGQLFRYGGYGFHLQQPLPGAAVMPDSVAAGRTLLMQELMATEYPFRQIKAASQQQTLLQLDLVVSSPTAAPLPLSQTLRLRYATDSERLEVSGGGE